MSELVEYRGHHYPTMTLSEAGADFNTMKAEGVQMVIMSARHYGGTADEYFLVEVTKDQQDEIRMMAGAGLSTIPVKGGEEDDD